MREILFQGMDELGAGFGIYFMLALASAIVQIMFGGWRGLRHALSIVCSALFFCIMAGWICQYYHLPWVATAAITCGAGLLSNAIMSIVFHPAIKEAIVKRTVNEIETRGWGRKKQSAQDIEDTGKGE